MYVQPSSIKRSSSKQCRIIIAAVAGLGCMSMSGLAFGQVVLSDSFSRSPVGSIVGTAPSRDTSPAAQAIAASSWVSSWGANNNAQGGYVSQTYTSYLVNEGNPPVARNYKVDGSNGISGNWLNNGSTAHPLKLYNSTDTITEPIGLTGFAWSQINHDFAADPIVASADRLRVSFNIYRSVGGNISWYMGQSDETGAANGNAGSPAVIASNDIGIYWRGGTNNTYSVRDNGALPSPVAGISNYDAIAYRTGTNFATTVPSLIEIEIIGTNFAEGQQSLVEMTINGIKQDLNGTDAEGDAYTLTWDNGAKVFMGFGSNNTPVEGTVAAPIYRANGIDNLRVLAVSYRWAGNNSGTWDTGGNWSAGLVPNASDIRATLGPVITGTKTVTLSNPVVLQRLNVDSGAATYVLDSAGGPKLSVGTLDLQSGQLDLDDSANVDAPVVAKVVNIPSGTRLNLRNGSLIVDYDGSSPLVDLVTAHLAERLTGNGDAVGIVEASAAGITSFRGVALDATAVVAIRTLEGDATLDQSVGFNDLLALARNYNASGKGWHEGDFNYDGMVGFTDLLALARNYNASLGSDGAAMIAGGEFGAEFAADFALAMSMVPEPATLGVLAGAGLLLGRRRR